MAYVILRKLEGGEFLPVATFDDLSKAQHLAEALYEYWPADYSVIALADGDLGRDEGFQKPRSQRAPRPWLN
jgi:hypothetical protein